MKYYIIAGEASGDLHAANLIKQLKAIQHQSAFRGWGGDLMKAEGVELLHHYRETAFMGFVEVIKNLRTIFRFLDEAKTDILNYKPDALILVDYPGFNLRIAEWAKQQNIRVIYYISPQVWAWKENRVKKIKRDVDLMLVILPFEKSFYKKWNFEVEFVGHPLLDAIKDFTPENLNLKNEKPIISLLPGSRMQEIKTMLPVMINAAKSFANNYQIVIAGAPSISDEVYQQFINDDVQLVRNKTYSLLHQSKAALVTSGTATLETALFNVPQVVCYKGGKISYWIGKQLIKIKFISLVNLIMDKAVVKELIQDSMNEKSLHTELEKLLTDAGYRNEMLQQYQTLKHLLGDEDASARAAKLISDFVELKN